MDSSQPDAALPERGETPEFLVALLYKELRRLAAGCLRRERPNHTLQPTALVNEAYLRLAAQNQPEWNDRVRFLAVASHLMREVLIDYARTRNRAKRGGGLAPICIEDAKELAAAGGVDLLARRAQSQPGKFMSARLRRRICPHLLRCARSAVRPPAAG